MSQRLRTWGLVLTLLAASAVFATLMHRHYAIGTWLFWRYLSYWGIALAWAGCCAALGYTILCKAFGDSLAPIERLTLGFALGVFAFGLGVFFLGLAHGLNIFTFFALPLAFLGASVHKLRAEYKVLRPHFSSWLALKINFWSLPIIALGLLGIGALYMQILSPEVFSFDSRWYHLPLAQRNALSGSVARYEEGFWMAAYPQLASYLYTWAFLQPGVLLFDRLELCAHMEFVLFLGTLAQVPVLVRVLVPGLKAGLSWVALFLFPGIYLYDSNLHAGADHVAAFFAIPIALTFWRTWYDFTPRLVLLFSVFLAAATLTKYTAVIAVIPPALALSARAVWLCGRHRQRSLWFALALLMVAPFVLTTPHWLKNWVWYGDPIYPMLHSMLEVRPWNPDTATQIKILEGVARPGSLTGQGLLKALAATVNFSFIPNDWYDLRRNVPMFGSLFTLTLPCLLFLRGGRRLWWLYGGSMLAVFVWYLLSHYDRFLQAVLPWMVAATAACLLLIWQSGWLARLALVPLVALQWIWGSDLPFVRTHNLIGDSPLRKAAQLIPTGFEKVKGRLDLYEPLTTLGKPLPPDAVVLAHDVMMILGIDRNWVTDLHQSRISYARLLAPEHIHDELTSLGVTHLIWPGFSVGREALAADLAFANYAHNYAEQERQHAGYTVARIPKQRPAPLEKELQVGVFSCGGPYRKGMYTLSQLTLPIINPGPSPKRIASVTTVEQAAAEADLLVVDTACIKEAPKAPFVYATARSTTQLWVKLRPKMP